jgi:hypothetical protein
MSPRNYWPRRKKGHLKTAQLAPRIHVPPPNAHVFVATGRYAASAKENDPDMEICARCDGVRRSTVHRIPEHSDEARQIDARKLGERSSGG